MILSEIQEINVIDASIQQLHASLVELYEKRRTIIKPAADESSFSSTASSLDELPIDLNEIDLSLD